MSPPMVADQRMAGLLDTSPYDRVFALDTQMVFEARPLTQLPWSALSSGPILLVILPQVCSEADARKRDGRLGTRARELNRMLDPSIELGGATQLVAEPVRVDIAYVPAGRPDWDRLDDLERENGDDRIVAQALHAKIDNPSRIEILSFDSRPRAGARRHGLGALKPDETWLLDPEPSPADRRVADLERRVQLLQANEPLLRLAIRTVETQPLVRIRVPQLPAEGVKPVVRIILAKNRREQNSGYFDLGLNRNPDYDSDYDDYSRHLGEIDIPNIHLGVARFFSQHGIEVEIENAGVMTAEHVAVELRSGNAVLHRAPFIVDIFGPPAPSVHRDLLANIRNLHGQLDRPDRTTFALKGSDDPSVQLEYRCQDFRHGRSQIITAVIEPTDRSGGVINIEVRVTAANMRGEVVERLSVPILVQDRALGELIGLDNLSLKVDPPIRDLLAPLLRSEETLAHFRNDGTPRE